MYKRQDSFQSGPPVFSDIQYSIIGDDENVLRAIGSELELIINDAPDVSHTKSLAGYSNTNIEFEFNSSNISLSGKNTELLVNELYAENNGIIVRFRFYKGSPYFRALQRKVIRGE